MMAFQRAERQRVWLKIAITGPSGSGKTYSALRLAFGLSEKRIAVLDSENDSASLYAHLGEYDVQTVHAPFTAQRYIEVIDEAVRAGYDVLVIDSLTHVWAGDGGLLAQKEAKDARGGNSYTNWAEITKFHEQLKAKLLQSPIHLIATMRSKQDYVIEQSNGKSAPKKVGMAPVQREGIEYEFTTVFDVDMSHTAATSKDRTGLFVDEVSQVTEDHGMRLKGWLAGGTGAAPQVVPVSQQAARPRETERPAASAAQRPQTAPASRPAASASPAPSQAAKPADERSVILKAIQAERQRIWGEPGTTREFVDWLGGAMGLETLKDAPVAQLVATLGKLKEEPGAIYDTAPSAPVSAPRPAVAPEAAPIEPAKAAEPAAAGDVCFDCERPLNAGQVVFSERKFGVKLCPACQKARGNSAVAA